jgi:Protein of unknown function, DUF547.
MRSSIFLFLCFCFIIACNSVKDVQSTSQPVTHELWDSLVKTHVSEAGVVNYDGFVQDKAKLQNYLDLISKAHPNETNWTRNEQLAYWLNAYNAFTVKLIVDDYPIKSIKNVKKGIPFINTVWDIKFIKIEGAKYDLNNIEHGIIRPKFKDPRIHFAANCAAISCPRLRNEAYTAEKLDSQLDDQARYFLRNLGKNNITAEQVKLSKILKWYGGDFDEYGGVRKFVNDYGPHTFANSVDIEYLDYLWPLNNQDINTYQPSGE